MSGESLIILAGALAAAVQNPQAPDDATRRAVALEDNTVAAYVDMVVDPQGNFDKCHVYKVWGKKELAGKLCALEANPGWKPAVGADGKPAWGVVREVLHFSAERPVSNEAMRIAETPEIELTVKSLPASRKRLDLQVSLQVAPDGQPQACEAQRAAVDVRAYAALACKEAMKVKVNAPPELNSAFVIGYRVRFSTGGSG